MESLHFFKGKSKDFTLVGLGYKKPSYFPLEDLPIFFCGKSVKIQ